MSKVTFPGLDVAAHRLGLDAGEMAEGVLHAIDCGHDEQEAMRMVLVDFLQRRGLYHGQLRRLVDSGWIFSLAEDDGNDDGRRARHMGGECFEPDSFAPTPRTKRTADDA